MTRTDNSSVFPICNLTSSKWEIPIVLISHRHRSDLPAEQRHSRAPIFSLVVQMYQSHGWVLIPIRRSEQVTSLTYTKNGFATSFSLYYFPIPMPKFRIVFTTLTHVESRWAIFVMLFGPCLDQSLLPRWLQPCLLQQWRDLDVLLNLFQVAFRVELSYGVLTMKFIQQQRLRDIIQNLTTSCHAAGHTGSHICSAYPSMKTRGCFAAKKIQTDRTKWCVQRNRVRQANIT